ncbi:MAG: pyrroline-5-carboxylate reductase [Rhodospirillaceae bacterium]|nr:pyrroline-5-carboxylate reductase [Rhodospirillaceae bacterium]
MTKELLLVGCGKMGGALLGGWLGRDVDPASVTIVEPYGADAIAAKFGVKAVEELDALDKGAAPGVVVYAVKPQAMDDIVPGYRRFVRPETVFLSIAAGRPISFFEKHLGDDAAIIRSMPNTPAAVGRGITVACGNAHITEQQKTRCHGLLEAVGEVAWVEDEGLMDAVTAVSGSGPAYVFLLIETMAEAGVAAGLDPALAEQLARATVIGSGELARQSPDPAATLRQNVTSPGGTTAAALDVLMDTNGMKDLMTRAIDAATRRSRELAG